MPETRTCRKCKEEYEPQYLPYQTTSGPKKFLQGYGFCLACALIACEEEEAKEKAVRDGDINTTRQRYIEVSGIPSRFRTESFSSFNKGWQDKALACCKDYAEEFPVNRRPNDYGSLYLWSGKSWGVGKSHLSCAIALRIFERWIGEGNGCPRIYFISESDLFRQIQATYSFTQEEKQIRDSEDDILRKLTSCALLILDDVGKESRADTRFVQRTLFGLIDGRYKRQLPIILTANVNADGLRRHLGGASFDRLFEMISGKTACMDGRSYRRRVKV